MGYVTQMAPYTTEQIFPLLSASAVAAGSACTGTSGGMTCSLQWTLGKYDGRARGVGELLSLLNVVNANLVKYVVPPVTHNTGGTSEGNPSAGTQGNPAITPITPATTADKVTAGVLTGVCAIFLGLGVWFMIS